MQGLDYEWSMYILMVHYIGNCVMADYFFLMLKPKRKECRKDYLIFCMMGAIGYTLAYPFRGAFLPHTALYLGALLMAIRYVFRYSGKELLVILAGFLTIQFSAEFFSFAVVGGMYEECYWNGPAVAMGVCIGYVYIFMGNMLVFAIWTSIKERIALKHLWPFIAFPVFEIVLMIAYIYEMRPLSARVVWMGSAILVLGYLVQRILMSAFWDVLEKIRVEEQLTGLYEKRQAEMDYYTIAANHIQEMRMLRHEFSNQLQTVYTMLTCHGNQKMKEAVYETMDTLERVQPTRYCENAILNAILVKKIKDAAAENVSMEMHVKVPENLRIEKIDLCSICCNLMDNAIEAGKVFYQSNKRKVCFEIGYEEDAFYIQTENYIDRAQRNVLLRKNGTTKERQEEHGYGLMLVKRLVEKYKGVFLQELEEERLRVTVRLPIRVKEGV